MKKLSIKEKAKRYDEALEGAKMSYHTGDYDEDTLEMLEIIFPELKESEDEMMRQRIIQAIRLRADDMNEEWSDEIAWLEKQGEQNLANSAKTCKDEQRPYGQREECADCQFNYAGECKGYCSIKQSEQKPADKVEPKFKVGDWVVWDNKISCHIDNIYQGKESLMYTITDVHNMTHSYSVKGFDNNAHLWTIADAKDGDVLVYGDNPNDNHVEVIMLFKSIRNEKSAFTHFHIFVDRFRIDDWSDCGKNTHPATREQRDILFQKMKEAGYEWDAEKKELKKIEQNPAWSEEDENRVNRLIAYFEDKESFTAEDDIVYANWLKSLKDRVQPKQEWSVDDERTYRSVLYDFERHFPLNCVQQEFVKSHIQPQNRWKPSEQQMEALQTVYDWYKNNLPQLTGMQSLFNDLLKLK